MRRPRAVRDLAGRFEHRLFLSATPHNGHSNSFSTLLELLDPYRFTRGVKVRGRKVLEDVMVRRLKEDIRTTQGGFPELAGLATRRLRERGEREARDLDGTLRRQRERIVEELERHEGQYKQITLAFDEEERRQLQSNMRYWRMRLDQFDRDLEQEPGRIRAFYEVQARRVEPVGLVYLWPETN